LVIFVINKNKQMNKKNNSIYWIVSAFKIQPFC
jgi:hypothetical protein